jgi:hypothetical protein
MTHKIYYDQENEIVVIEFAADFLLKEVEPMFKNVMELLEGKPYRQLLTVLTGKHTVENRETREATNRALTQTKISEVAFVGGSAASRMLARVLIKTGIIKVSGDFFSSRADAINWLKSKRIMA